MSVTCSFKDLASVPSHLITYPALILPSWKVPFVLPPHQSPSSHNLCPYRPPTPLWSYHTLPCITFAFMSVTSLKLDRNGFFFFLVYFFISSFFRANTAFYLLLLLLFSHSAVSNSLWPPSPSPPPGHSCPLSQWCHLTILSSVVLFFSCLQSFPASESCLMSQFFPSGGQSIRSSASASVLSMNIQDWFPLGWTGWIS